MAHSPFHFGQFRVNDIDYYYYNGKYYADNGTVAQVISIKKYRMAYINTL